MSTALVEAKPTVPAKAERTALSDVSYQEVDFPSLRLTRSSRRIRSLASWLVGFLGVSVIAMLFVPWQQSIKGNGAVVAFNPVNRTQEVSSAVKGIIAEIGPGVYENAPVKEGQLIYRIIDPDPNYLPRLRDQVTNTKVQLLNAEQRIAEAQAQQAASERVVKAENQVIESIQLAQKEAMAAADAYVSMAENKLSAEQAGLQAAKDAVWQTKLDYNRKKKLSSKGFETGLKFQEAELKLRQSEAKQLMAEQYVKAATNEVIAKKRDRDTKREEFQAKIDKAQSGLEKAEGEVAKANIGINKTREELAKMKNELAKIETQRDRQLQQDVLAPRDGRIMRLIAYDKSSVVKQGDKLFTLVPEIKEPAVQVWVNGNDAPLIAPGRPVRLQFEGWPAVQFSGWPSVAVGTFGGKVAIVDPTDDNMGKFRVVIVPDEEDDPWPEYPYLRQGVRTHGWVLLDQVPLGYELWRRMNGFPPALKSKEAAEKVKPPKIKI